MPKMGGFGSADVDALIAVHAAVLDAHIRSREQELITGQYWGSAGVNDTSTVLSANTIYATPLVIPRLMSFDRIAIHIASGAGIGEEGHLGIYNSGVNLYPGSLLLDAGIISASSTGVKAIVINKQLAKGIFFLVYLPNASHGVKSRERGYNDVIQLGVSSDSLGYSLTDWKAAQTYGALPDPFPAGGTLDYDYSVTVLLRVASLD